MVIIRHTDTTYTAISPKDNNKNEKKKKIINKNEPNEKQKKMKKSTENRML